jgi:hypothetical protein
MLIEQGRGVVGPKKPLDDEAAQGQYAPGELEGKREKAFREDKERAAEQTALGTLGLLWLAEFRPRIR